MTDVGITAHAVKRARQRAGLHRRALPRVAARAWDRGATVRDVQIDQSCVVKAYGNQRYVFSVLTGVPMLITVLGLIVKDEDRAGLRRDAEHFERKSDRRKWAARRK